MGDKLPIVGLSLGKEITPEIIEANPSLKLGLLTVGWLSRNGIASILHETDDGVILIRYSAHHPNLRIEAGKLVFPKGTPLQLITAYLEGK